MNTKRTLIVSFVLAIGLANIACQEITGADELSGLTEQQEIQRNARAVGPAGENGSLLYADRHVPNAAIGKTGDFYLNLWTGELYGPKTNGKWGVAHRRGSQSIRKPDAVESGGSVKDQIHAGENTPDVSFGTPGDYYLNTATYQLYGPKTGSGWELSINLQALAAPQSPQQPEEVPQTPPIERLPGPVQFQVQ